MNKKIKMLTEEHPAFCSALKLSLWYIIAMVLLTGVSFFCADYGDGVFVGSIALVFVPLMTMIFSAWASPEWKTCWRLWHLVLLSIMLWISLPVWKNFWALASVNPMHWVGFALAMYCGFFGGLTILAFTDLLPSSDEYCYFEKDV